MASSVSPGKDFHRSELARTMETTKFCAYCKEEIKVDAIKCRHCGSMLGGESVIVAGGSTTSIKIALASKYEILDEIGRGGMAVVYKAIQKNLERVVALKALPPTLIHDKAFLERFHREARSAARLSHPNIIIVHDEGVEGESTTSPWNTFTGSI